MLEKKRRSRARKSRWATSVPIAGNLVEIQAPPTGASACEIVRAHSHLACLGRSLKPEQDHGRDLSGTPTTR